MVMKFIKVNDSIFNLSELVRILTHPDKKRLCIQITHHDNYYITDEMGYVMQKFEWFLGNQDYFFDFSEAEKEGNDVTFSHNQAIKEMNERYPT